MPNNRSRSKDKSRSRERTQSRNRNNKGKGHAAILEELRSLRKEQDQLRHQLKNKGSQRPAGGTPPTRGRDPRWTCPSTDCMFADNYAFRLTCLKCSTKRPHPASGGQPQQGPTSPSRSVVHRDPPGGASLLDGAAASDFPMAEPTPLSMKQSMARAMLAAAKSLPVNPESEELVTLYEQQLATMKDEERRGMPLHAQLKSALDRVDAKRRQHETLCTEQKQLEETLLAKTSAVVEAQAALQQEQQELARLQRVIQVEQQGPQPTGPDPSVLREALLLIPANPNTLATRARLEAELRAATARPGAQGAYVPPVSKAPPAAPPRPGGPVAPMAPPPPPAAAPPPQGPGPNQVPQPATPPAQPDGLGPIGAAHIPVWGPRCPAAGARPTPYAGGAPRSAMDEAQRAAQALREQQATEQDQQTVQDLRALAFAREQELAQAQQEQFRRLREQEVMAANAAAAASQEIPPTVPLTPSQ